MRAGHIDIVIPTYNGRNHLHVCLEALERQSYRNFTVWIVDDGSTDDTIEWIENQWPQHHIIPLERNAGLAAAINVGIQAGDGEFVTLLNNDTEPDNGWLGALLQQCSSDAGTVAVASRMMLFDRRNVFHSAGDTYSLPEGAGNRGVWQIDIGQYNTSDIVFGACAGAALYRRGALEDVERVTGSVLETDLFMYLEDVDLNWRLRLLGGEIRYAPDALVYHHLSATGGGTLASYYVARNHLAIIVRNVPAGLLRRWLPSIARHQVREFLATVKHLREPAARARLRGLLAAPVFAWRQRQNRWTIQHSSRVSLTDILRVLGN